MLAASVLCSVAMTCNLRAAEDPATKPVKPLDVKYAFLHGCSFCHKDYGRRAGKGPKLMDSEKSDAFLFKRIKYGKFGSMEGYGRALSDEQIQQMVAFIRSLKPDEEPQNP